VYYRPEAEAGAGVAGLDDGEVDAGAGDFDKE
jgi:hypothetical protein